MAKGTALGPFPSTGGGLWRPCLVPLTESGNYLVLLRSLPSPAEGWGVYFKGLRAAEVPSAVDNVDCRPLCQKGFLLARLSGDVNRATRTVAPQSSPALGPTLPAKCSVLLTHLGARASLKRTSASPLEYSA